MGPKWTDLNFVIKKVATGWYCQRSMHIGKYISLQLNYLRIYGDTIMELQFILHCIVCTKIIY